MADEIVGNDFPCLGVDDVLGFPAQAPNPGIPPVFIDRVGNLAHAFVQPVILGHVFYPHLPSLFMPTLCDKKNGNCRLVFCNSKYHIQYNMSGMESSVFQK